MSGTKRILLLLFFACVVGLLYQATALFIRFGIGGDYKGIIPEISGDERHYLRQIQTAMEGHYYPPNRYIYEYWSGSVRGGMPNFEGFNLHGFLGARLGFSFWNWIYLSRSLFPIIAFYILYRLFRVLRFSPRGATSLALYQVLIAYALQGRVEFLLRYSYEFLVRHGWESGWIFWIYKFDLPFSRPVNPSFTGLFFLSALLFLAQWLNKPGKIYKLVVMAFFAWLSFKTYFYFWSALGAVLAGVWIVALFRREWRVVIPLSVLLVGGMIYVLPKIAGLLSPGIPEERLFLGMVPSRKILITPAVLVSLFLSLLLFRYRKMMFLPFGKKSLTNLVWAMPIAIILTMNQQLITGRIVQPWHYELYTSPVLLSIFFFPAFLNARNAQSLIRWIGKYFTGRWGRVYAVAGVMILFLFGGFFQIFLLYFRYSPHTSHAIWPVTGLSISLVIFSVGLVFLVLGAVQYVRGVVCLKRISSVAFLFVVCMVVSEAGSKILLRGVLLESLAKQENRLAGAITWLKKQPAGVVLSEPTVADMVALYTHHSIYISTNATYYYMPKRPELRQRLYHMLVLFNETPEHFLKRAVVLPYRFIIWGMVPTDEKRELFTFGEIGQVSNQNREIALSDFMAERRSLMENRGRLWKLDYIIVRAEDMRDFTNPPIKDFVEMPPAYSDAYAMIYRLKKAQTE